MRKEQHLQGVTGRGGEEVQRWCRINGDVWSSSSFLIWEAHLFRQPCGALRHRALVLLLHLAGHRPVRCLHATQDTGAVWRGATKTLTRGTDEARLDGETYAPPGGEQ